MMRCLEEGREQRNIEQGTEEQGSEVEECDATKLNRDIQLIN